MKKRQTKLFLFLSILVFIMALSSCANTQDNNNGNVQRTSEPVLNLSVYNSGVSVFAGDSFTVGLLADGSVIATGRDTHGQMAVHGMTDIAMVAAYGNTVALLGNNGLVSVYGENAESFKNASLWKDIVSISLGEKHIVALNKEGRVLACGSNEQGQCDVFTARCIVAIAAGKEHTVMITQGGSVICVGNKSDNRCTTLDWTNVVSIAAGDNFTAALTKSGEILLTSGEFASGWKNIKSIYASGDRLYAVTHDGNALGLTEEYESESAANIMSLAASHNHVVLLYADGTVTGIGETDDKQCDTQNWALILKQHEDGSITGFYPNMSIETAKDFLLTLFEGEITIKRGEELLSDGIIATGDELFNNNEKVGTALIYGDADGDGIITLSDVGALEKHIEGSKSLSGVYLKASDILHYVGGTRALGNKHIAALKEAVEMNGKNIRQFTYNPYESRTLESYDINSDVSGWISIPGTNINHPILYGDGYYYHERTIYKEHYSGGSLYFLNNSLCKNNAIAGHNMRKTKTMFHQLHTIQNNAEELKIYKNRVFGIWAHEGYAEWEVFALYETKSAEPVDTIIYNINNMSDFSDEQVQEWIDHQVSRSEVELDVNVTPNDTFIVLYTCGDYYDYDRDGQARLYFFLRRVG